MKVLKSHNQIRRPNNLTYRPGVVKSTAASALMLLSLTAGIALPDHPQFHQASDQTTMQPAKKKGWVLSGTLNTPRYHHTATLLVNGQVLVAGGAVGPFCECCCAAHPDSRPTDRAEIYDPAAKEWSNTRRLNTARFRHSATLLENGKVLVTGGYADVNVFEGLPLRSAELYDPVTGGWLFTGSFITIQGSNSATLLPNGKVLAVSGSSAELYDPDTGTWSITNSPNIGGGLIPSTILLPNGNVLAVSGNSAALFDSATGTWGSTSTPKVLSFYSQTMTLLRNGKVLVTGLVNSAPSIPGAELYDPATGIWSITDYPGAARYWESYRTTLLADGRVLLAGGQSSWYSVYGTRGEEVYDPAPGTWNYTSQMTQSRHYLTATALPDGSVLVAGGVDEGSDQYASPYSSAELYDPRTNPILLTPRITSAFVSGKKLFVFGENFDSGAAILLNGEEQKTKNDDQNPKTFVIGKRAGKKIKPGDNLQIRNPDGSLSQEFVFTG